MSSKPNKKKLRTQLKDLFKDLDEEKKNIQGLSLDRGALGWIWECSSELKYTVCSPEIQEILGFKSSDFLNQEVKSFAVEERSQNAIQSGFESSKFPVQVDVNFISSEGETKYAVLHIFKKTKNGNGSTGLYGFTEIFDPTLLKKVNALSKTALAPVSFDLDSKFEDILPPSSTMDPEIIDEIENPISVMTDETLQFQEDLMEELSEIADKESKRDLPEENLPSELTISDKEKFVEENLDIHTATSSTADLKDIEEVENPISAMNFESLTLHKGLAEEETEIAEEDPEINQPEDDLPAEVTASDTEEFVEEENLDIHTAVSSTTDEDEEINEAENPISTMNVESSTLHEGLAEDETKIAEQDSEINQPADDLTAEVTTSDTEDFIEEENLDIQATISSTVDEDEEINEAELEVPTELSQENDIDPILENQESSEDELAKSKNEKIISDFEETESETESPVQLHDSEMNVLESSPPHLEEPILPDDLDLEKELEIILDSDVEAAVFPDEAELTDDLITEAQPAQLDASSILKIVDDDPNRNWSEDEIQLVEEVTEQLSLALENANLFQRTQEALAETDILYKASAELNSANSYLELLEVLKNHTVAGEDNILIGLNMFNTVWTLDEKPSSIETLARSTNLNESMLRSRFKGEEIQAITNFLDPVELIAVQDITIDKFLEETVSKILSGLSSPVGGIFIPVTVAGNWLGYIDIYFSKPAIFTDSDLRKLSSIAQQVSEKTVSLQLGLNAEERRKTANELNLIARQMGEILSEEELTQWTLELIHEKIKPNQLSLYMWDPDKRVFKVESRMLAENIEAEDDYQIGEEIEIAKRPDLYNVLTENIPEYTVANLDEGLIKENYIMPWLVGDNTVGLVEIIHTSDVVTISHTDQELFHGVVLQAGSAIERAQLFDQTQTALTQTDEQARRLRLLNELSEVLGLAGSLEEVFDIAIQKISQVFAVERINISLLSEDREYLEVTAAAGDLEVEPVGDKIALEDSIHQEVLDNNEISIVTKVSTASLDKIRSYILGPISSGGENIGTLYIGSTKVNVFKETDSDFISQMLSLLGAAIENRRLFEAIEVSLSNSEEQARRLTQLNNLSKELNSATTFEEVILITIQQIHKIIPTDGSSVAIKNPESSTYKEYQIDPETGDLSISESHDLENTIIEKAITNNQIYSEFNMDQSDHRSTGSLIKMGLKSAIIAPLSAGSAAMGTLNIGQLTPDSYTSQDENLMQSISSLVASTIDNRQLFIQIQKRSTQLETSAEVSRVASTILDTEELLPKVVDLIRDGFGLYYAGLFLVDESGIFTGEPNKWAVLQAGTGDAGRQMIENGHKLEIGGDSMIGSSISNMEARIALDVGEEAKFFRNPYLPETRSEMALPLNSRGQALGALSIQSVEEAAFSQEDITSLQTLADQIANTIENARLFEQSEMRAEELTVLNEMARSFTQSFDVNQIIQETYEYTKRLMDASNFYMALYHPEEDEIEFMLVTEDDTPIDHPTKRRKLGNGLTEWIIRNRQPLLLEEDIAGRLLAYGIESVGDETKSWLGVPMLRGKEAIGVMAVQSFTTPRQYGGHQLDLLSAVANQSTVAIDNAKRFEESQSRARREKLLREITTKVHSSADPDMILRTAVKEVGTALGREAYIELRSKTPEELKNIVVEDLDSEYARETSNSGAASAPLEPKIEEAVEPESTGSKDINSLLEPESMDSQDQIIENEPEVESSVAPPSLMDMNPNEYPDLEAAQEPISEIDPDPPLDDDNEELQEDISSAASLNSEIDNFLEKDEPERTEVDSETNQKSDEDDSAPNSLMDELEQ